MLLAALAAVMMIAGALPAAAITQGTPDGNRHPMVGQLFFHVPDDPDPRFTTPGAWYSCTGTQISATVVLTAGHCTWAVGLDGESTLPDGVGGNDVWITFSEVPNLDDILAPSLSFDGDNQARYETWSEALEADPTWHRGTAQSHPDYDDRSFFLADVGVVVLHEPIERDAYGELPEVGYLDRVKADRTHDKLFTPVGYGVQSLVPVYDPGGTRQFSTSKLIDVRGTHGIPAGVAAKFTNNLGKKHTGGACSGDSGGPLFEQGSFLIGAITSYGISPCIGNDGAYRIDKTLDLAWIGTFLD
ncbi:trypsin-like serine protease [Egicoccus sp. AB-alg2]|uniref:trypsin-like serine protease n=1 Tax=Egicoccus sp. AB-alg2 TaxID=3242693 RepID=UPI00359E48CA